MAEMKLSELANFLEGQLQGPADATVTGVASLNDATQTQVSFLANAKYANQLETTKALAVIVSEDYDGPGKSLIRCKDPYFAFRQALVALVGFRKHPYSGISDQAIIDPTAKIGANVIIAPFAVISENAEVGDNSVIYPSVFVGPNCKIGADCIVYPNVTIYDDCKLGDRVTVHAGCSIGQDGFGYATHPNKQGEVVHDKIPQVGWVELEDDVEIGACCAIDRAAMGPTVIGAGTKFSNLIAIGHGTKMGKHCLTVAQTGIAGSVNVGNYCVFGGQAGIVGHIEIGDGVRIAAQSGVTNNVPAGQDLLGSPAIPRAEARRVMMSTMKLPEIRNDVKKLKKQIAKLQEQLNDLSSGE